MAFSGLERSNSLKDDAVVLQLGPQLMRVVDGAVVYQGDSLPVVHVRVSVLVGFPTFRNRIQRPGDGGGGEGRREGVEGRLDEAGGEGAGPSRGTVATHI